MALRDVIPVKQDQQDLDVPATQEFELGDIFRLDMTGDHQGYLVDQKSGNYVCLSNSAYSLLKAVESGLSFQALADTLNMRQNVPKVSAKQLREAHEKIMEKLRVSKMKPDKNTLPFGFWLRFSLVPEQIVHRISGGLAFLYQPFWVGILIFFIAASGVDLWRIGLFKPTHTDLLIAYGIYLITLVAHEFGHTAACCAFGIQPKEIGFTIYLIYPAFYSDVSSCWRLSRWQRVVVDLGGFYFQLVTGSMCLLLYHITGWTPLWVAEIVIAYTAVFSLNPIFKFDGYWVLADMLGVANLGKQPLRIAKHFWAVVLGRPRTMLPWPTTISLIVIVYSTISCVVWFLFMIRLEPSLRYQVLSLFHSSKSIVTGFSISGKSIWLEIEKLFFAIFQLTIIAVMCWNLGRRFFPFRAGSKGAAT